MYCRLCGKEVQDGEEFCSSCLTEQGETKEIKTKFCPFCGETVKGIESFCFKCDGYLGGKKNVAGKTVSVSVQKPKETPKTKRCKSCFAEIPADAFYCPKCSKMADAKPVLPSSTKTDSAKKGFLLGFLLGIMGVFLAWCFGDDEMLECSFTGFLVNLGIVVVIAILIGTSGNCVMDCISSM